MIRNMHDPLYKRVFEAQAHAQIMAAPYIQRNIEAVLAHLHDRFGDKYLTPSIVPRFAYPGCRSYVEIVDTICSRQMDVETLFKLCDPKTICIDSSFEYWGTYLYELPGVTLRVSLYAKVSPEDAETLRELGHVTTRRGDAYHSIICEV